MILYHATPMRNLGSIMQDGLVLGVDNVVYGCEKPKDALKFAFFHGVDDVLMIKFKVPRKCVVETFDHSETVFKCRCWGSTVPVTTDMIVGYRKHDCDLSGRDCIILINEVLVLCCMLFKNNQLNMIIIKATNLMIYVPMNYLSVIK